MSISCYSIVKPPMAPSGTENERRSCIQNRKSVKNGLVTFQRLSILFLQFLGWRKRLC